MADPYELADLGPEHEPTPGTVHRPEMERESAVFFPDRHRYCRGCGYDLHRSPTPACAECGRPFDPEDLTSFALEPPEKRWRGLPWRVWLLAGLFAIYALPVWLSFWMPMGAWFALALMWPAWLGVVAHLGLTMLPEGWVDSTIGQLATGAMMAMAAQVLLTLPWLVMVHWTMDGPSIYWGVVAVSGIFGMLGGLMHRWKTI